MEWKFLVEVSERESIIIESVLRSMNIFVKRKYPDDVMEYMRTTGALFPLSIRVALYVPVEFYDRAQKTIKALRQQE